MGFTSCVCLKCTTTKKQNKPQQKYMENTTGEILSHTGHQFNDNNMKC